MRELETGPRSRLHTYIEQNLLRHVWGPFHRAIYATLPGQAEGIFGWVAANYDHALPRFDGSKGYLEMGGQTMQVAFKTVQDQVRDTRKAFHRIKIGEEHNVFTHCWETGGADAKWNSYLDSFVGHAGVRDNADIASIPVLVDSTGTGTFVDCLRGCHKLLGCPVDACQNLTGICPVVKKQGCLIQRLPQHIHTQLPNTWVGSAAFIHGVRGGFPDLRISNEYNPLRLLRDAYRLHTMSYTRCTAEAAYQSNPQYLWRAVFNAVYTSVTLHLGLGVPMAPGDGFAAQVSNLIRRVLDDVRGIPTQAQLQQFLEALGNLDPDNPGPEWAEESWAEDPFTPNSRPYSILDSNDKPWALGAALVYAMDVGNPGCLRDLVRE